MASDISEMINEIEKESQTLTSELLRIAQEKQATLLSEGKSEIEDFEREQEKKLESLAHYESEQVLDRQDLKARQELLKVKQDILKMVFEQSVLAMEDWSAEETLDFIAKILTQTDFKSNWTLILGEKTASKLRNHQVELSNIISQNQVATFELYTVPLKGQSGFILSQNGIEYNFLYQSLIQELKGDLELEISRKLFD